MKIFISGINGFVGSLLKDFLTKKGHIVEGIPRSILSNPIQISHLIDGCDVLINLNGSTINKRFNKKNKKIIYASRVLTTNNLVSSFHYVKVKPKVFISASAIGIYDSSHIHTESSVDYCDGFMKELVLDWEKEAFNAENYNVKTIILRFGLILDSKGGVLAKLKFPFKNYLGFFIGNGNQYMSYISGNELLMAVHFLLNNINSQGIYNLVSPQYVSNYVFSQSLAKTLNKPIFIVIPKFLLKLIFKEGASVLINSSRVLPERLINEGFIFSNTQIDFTLQQILNNKN